MNSATDTFPRYALFRDKKCRVIEYRGDDRWLILDTRDAYRVVSGLLLTFLKDKLYT